MLIPFERKEVDADGSERAPPTVTLVKPVQLQKFIGKCLEQPVNVSNRYFKRRGFDMYLRHVDRGSKGKIPLTIDMLYQAVKAKRWNTRALEARRFQES